MLIGRPRSIVAKAFDALIPPSPVYPYLLVHLMSRTTMKCV